MNNDIPALIKAIQYQDNEIHNQAIQALSDLKPFAEVIIPQLILEIENAPPSPLEYYAVCKLKSGRDGSPPQYSDINASNISGRKFPMRDVVGIIEKYGQSAIPPLENAIKKGNERSLIWINAVLAKITPKNEKYIQYLIDTLGKKDTFGFLEATDALRFVGPRAQNAIPALIELPKKHPFLGWIVVPALEEIGQPAVPFLVQEISKENNPVCFIYEAALGGILPAQQNVIDLLVNYLQPRDENKENLLNLIFSVGALSSMGPQAKSAIPFLDKVFTYDLIPVAGRKLDVISKIQGSLSNITSIDEASYYMNLLIALHRAGNNSGNGFGKVVDWITYNCGLRSSNPYGWMLCSLQSDGFDTGYSVGWGDTFTPSGIVFKAISNISGINVTEAYINEKLKITENRHQSRFK